MRGLPFLYFTFQPGAIPQRLYSISRHRAVADSSQLHKVFSTGIVHKLCDIAGCGLAVPEAKACSMSCEYPSFCNRCIQCGMAGRACLLLESTSGICWNKQRKNCNAFERDTSVQCDFEIGQ